MHFKLGPGVWIVALGAALTWGSARSQADILYNQPAVFPSGFNGFASLTTPTGTGFQTFDNFQLGVNGQINGFTWQGLYFDFFNSTDNPPAPNTTSWQLSFYADNAGTPGALLSSQVLTGVTSQFAGTGTFGPDNNGKFDPIVVDNYEGTLSQPFIAAAGQPLWVSIVSNSPAFPPGFYWTQGTGGDDESFQINFFNGPPGSIVGGDRAFSLQGDIVPEPSSLALLTGGAVGLLVAKKRRGRLRRPGAPYRILGSA